MYYKHYILLLLCLVIAGCQSPSLKVDTDDSISFDQETWKQSQKQVIDNIRDSNFDAASSLLDKMISNAGEEDSHWQYIRMIITVLPTDHAMPLINKAIAKPLVQQSPEHLLAFSRQLMQHKALEPAINLSQQAVAIEKTEATIYWRARLLSYNRNYSEAEQDYLWLLEQSPEKTDYISQYAGLKMQQDKLSEAEDILKGHSEDSSLLYQYILILLQQDKSDQAKEQYQFLKQSIIGQELTAEEKLEYGEVAMWLDDHDTALSLLNDIDDAEHIYPAKLLLARVYLAQGNSERATVLFKQVQNAPQDHAIPAFQMAAEYHHSEGRIDQAIAELSEGLRFFKEQADLLYSRALLYAQQNNVQAAERDLKNIITQYPAHADALNALGYTWADNDVNLELALDYINQANELKPNNSAILDSLGWVYFKLGEFSKAEQYLREALQLSFIGEETYQHLIDVLEAQNKTQEADLMRQKLLEFKADKS